MSMIRSIHSAMLLATTGIVMTGAMTTWASDLDAKIEAAVKSSYNFKTYLKDDHIQVRSSAGVVTLSGTVAHDYNKSLAQETAAGLPGVKGVNNQLTVDANQPAEHSDAWVTLKVKSALLFHKNVSGTSTDVKTTDGVVTLTGKAATKAQRELTTEYVKDVEGVKDVRNELVVGTSAKVDDRTLGDKVDDASITAQIKTTLLFHKSTSALATQVTTKDGVVTLHGEAKNGAERDLVSKLAEDIKGVKHVHNKMNVQKA